MSYEAKRAADRFYAEGRKNSRPGMWRGMNFVSGAQLDAEDEQQRKLAQLELTNEGQLAVEDRKQVGGTARTNLEQMAWNQRHGAELGFKYDDLGRQVTDADRTYDLEKFKAFTTPEAGGIPANPMQRAAQFEAMRELGNPNQNNMLQDNQGSGWVESADGTRFLTDPTGGISQQAAPSEVNLTPLPGYQSDPGRRDYSGINQSVIAPSRTTGPGESIAESSGLTRKLKKLKDYLWITPEQYNRR